MRAYKHGLFPPGVLGAAAVLTLVGAVLAASPKGEHLVSQKGKQFGPGTVNLHPGEYVTIVNDDSNFVHHAYVDAPDLAYDSGDIEPGGKAMITFPGIGDFTVLCGIHPKMRLAIHVQ